MEQAFGLYTHIRSNQRRSVALLIGLFLLVYVMVYAGALVAEGLMGDAPLDFLLQAALRDFIAALPWATLGTIVWIFIAYHFHQSMIDAITGGYEVSRRQEPRLWNILENLCISRGLTVPKLKLMDSEALNAFASGLNQKQYSITVTRGLLERLEDPEIEAVLGHELTHIRNGDVRLLVIAVVIAGVIAFFAELIVRMFFQSGLYWGGRRRDSESRGGGGGAAVAIVIAIALIAVAWLLSVVIRFALSRSREFLADAGSVELTKNPDAMIAALRKIEGRGDLERANSAVMEMCIDNPREDFANLFDTHPAGSKRPLGHGRTAVPAGAAADRCRQRTAPLRPLGHKRAAGRGRSLGSAPALTRHSGAPRSGEPGTYDHGHSRFWADRAMGPGFSRFARAPGRRSSFI